MLTARAQLLCAEQHRECGEIDERWTAPSFMATILLSGD